MLFNHILDKKYDKNKKKFFHRRNQGARAPPIEMPLMIKMWQKSLLFLQLLLASLRTTAINNNIDPECSGLLNSILPTYLNV